jgi:hypothetical protein
MILLCDLIMPLTLLIDSSKKKALFTIGSRDFGTHEFHRGFLGIVKKKINP